MTLTWYQGERQARALEGERDPASGTSGVLFVGDKGMLLSDYEQALVLLAGGTFTDFKRPDPHPSRSRSAITPSGSTPARPGAPTTCNFEYAGRLTEANHLGNVAYRAGKKLEWDTAAMRATNAPEAEPFLHREYRKGWTLTT